jgi:hypothetical protein
MYKEQIYKVAFDEEKAEKKVLVRELNRPIMTKNKTSPKRIGWNDYDRTPNNFIRGSKVKTTLNLDFDKDENGKRDINYRTTSTGRALKTNYILAHKNNKDFLKNHLKGETRKQYNERKQQAINKAVATRKRWALGALGVTAAGGFGSVAAGRKFGGKVLGNKQIGGVMGGVYGLPLVGVAGASTLLHGITKSNKNYLKGLKPHELEELIKVKENDAKELSQHPHKADLVIEA